MISARNFALFFTAFTLLGCAHKRPEPIRESKPVLARGWTFVESDKERLELGASEGQFTLGSAAIADEKVIFGSERFGIVAVNKRTGMRLWSRKIPKGVNGQILVYKKQVFFGADDGKFRCLDLNSGRLVWEADMGFPSEGLPLMVSDRVYTYSSDDAVHAFDPATGKSLWVYKRAANGHTRVIGGGNLTYFSGQIWTGFSDGSLVALDPLDGSVKSEASYTDNLKFTDMDAQPLPWRNGILVTTFDGKLRYLSKELNTFWEFPAGGARAPIIGQGSTLFLPSSDGTIYSVNGTSGTENWRFVLKRGVPTGIVLAKTKSGKSILLAGTSHDQILAIDADNGSELGSINIGGNSGTFSYLAFDEETRSVFFVSAFSRLFQLRLEI